MEKFMPYMNQGHFFIRYNYPNKDIDISKYEVFNKFNHENKFTLNGDFFKTDSLQSERAIKCIGPLGKNDLEKLGEFSNFLTDIGIKLIGGQ